MIIFRVLAVVLSGLQLCGITVPGAWFAIDSALLAKALRQRRRRPPYHPYRR